MDALTISGYGFDLTDLNNQHLTDQETKLFNQITEIDGLLDVAQIIATQDDEQFGDVALEVPCNTDDFSCYIYIPDISPVSYNSQHEPQPKLYNQSEANQHLADYLARLLEIVYTEDIDGVHPSPTLNAVIDDVKRQIIERKLPSHEQFCDYC